MAKLDKNNQILNKTKSNLPIRGFSEEKPPKELIEEIIKAGKLTHYSTPGIVDGEYSRRFFIFEKGNMKSEKLALLMENNATDRLRHVENLILKNPFMKSKFQNNLNMLRYGVDKCVTEFTTAPYFIIVSDMNAPPSEQEPLTQVMTNMQLKATAFDLNFQIIRLPCGNLSLISQMAGNEELMKLLELPIKKFAINGCAIGYSATNSS